MSMGKSPNDDAPPPADLGDLFGVLVGTEFSAAIAALFVGVAPAVPPALGGGGGDDRFGGAFLGGGRLFWPTWTDAPQLAGLDTSESSAAGHQRSCFGSLSSSACNSSSPDLVEIYYIMCA